MAGIWPCSEANPVLFLASDITPPLVQHLSRLRRPLNPQSRTHHTHTSFIPTTPHYHFYNMGFFGSSEAEAYEQVGITPRNLSALSSYPYTFTV